MSEPARHRDAYAVFQPMQTRWRDNDQFGHMYNATYLELFDEAMNMSLIDKGFLDYASDGPIMVVVENGCLFLREVAYPDRLTIGLRVAHIGRTSTKFEMGMFRADDPTESARSHFVMVTVDNTTRRPVPIPDEQRAALESMRTP